MSVNLSRRTMLESLLGASPAALLRSPAALLLQSLLTTVIAEEAWGQGVVRRSLLDIRNDGAPPRWMFDLFLTPYSDASNFQKNAHLGTRFIGSGANFDEVAYQTRLFSGINVPWMWQFDVPKSDGTMRPMRDLLPNLMHIRGIDSNSAAHAGASQNYYLPLGTVQSVPALSADASNLPLASINAFTQNFIFRSLRNKTSSTLVGQNLIRELLTPFLSESGPNFSSLKKNLNSYLTDVRDDLRASAEDKQISHLLSAESLKSARELILQGFGSVDAVWAGLLNKYASLVSRSFDMSYEMAGINNRPIGISPASRDRTYQVNGTIIQNPDMRTMITTTCSVENLAASFALAEYVLSQNLSFSLTLGLGRVTGLTHIAGTTTTRIAAPVDEHTVGAMPSLLINTYRSRAIAACLLELTDQLRAKSIFNRTLISIGSEFNRSPRADGQGSDHGYQGASVALYSGSIKSSQVVGNVLANAPNVAHPGSWGWGAANPELGGGQILDYGYLASSMASLLGVPSTITSRSPFVSESSTEGIVSAIGKGKEV